MIIVEIVVFILGLLIVVATLLSAIRTLILPRSAPDLLVRIIFVLARWLFELGMRVAKTYEERDRILSYYAPVGLLSLLPFWLTTTLIGFMGMNWSLGIRPWEEAFTVSGSSLLTLGFARGEALSHTILAFSEATIGLILVALLIAYLPTMYSAFSRREQAVTLLETRAGSPPSALELISRAHRILGLASMDDFWETWETWFAELEESHTSLPALVFFRSPRPDRSWVTASVTVLDTAALFLSTLDVPWNPQAALCIRAGFLALRRISDFFNVAYNPDPAYPADPISVTRAEFEAACDQLAGQGIPLKLDREQAWRDFAGWRVNYDAALIALCSMTMAPDAAWSSDRSPAYTIPPMISRRR